MNKEPVILLDSQGNQFKAKPFGLADARELRRWAMQERYQVALEAMKREVQPETVSCPHCHRSFTWRARNPIIDEDKVQILASALLVTHKDEVEAVTSVAGTIQQIFLSLQYFDKNVTWEKAAEIFSVKGNFERLTERSLPTAIEGESKDDENPTSIGGPSSNDSIS